MSASFLKEVFRRSRAFVGIALRSYLSFARGEKAGLSPWVFAYPFGLVAKGVVSLRNFAFDHGLIRSEETPLPVVSVGNITLGGTNKTPFVEMLCRMFQEAGIVPGIISRGYGGETVDPVVIHRDGQVHQDGHVRRDGHVHRDGQVRRDGQVIVDSISLEPGTALPLSELRDLVGDEPLLLASRLPGVPVAVSKDRLRDVEVLLNSNVQLIVADDAFQHRRMGRDADIVLVDACCPFGNGWIAPAGILREHPSVLARASLVVVTKSDQVEPERLEQLVGELAKYVSEENLFFSRISLQSWRRWNGEWKDGLSPRSPGLSSSASHGCALPGMERSKVLAFSAIGSPESFRRSLERAGVAVLREHRFKDHYRYRREDMETLEASLEECGADCMVCTEKDVYNLPSGWKPSRDILVPFIATALDDEERFKRRLSEALRPRMVVASNGYGEDAMGVLLARKLLERFPSASVSAFPIVGRGEHYSNEGIRIDSVPSDSPSGGVIKYRFADLWRDIRSGLLQSIARQMGAWKSLRGRIRTPLCVGDVYLLLHALWGQGQIPVLVATAKTVYLSGHWRLERFLIKHRSRIAWTRDRDTAEELKQSGVLARFDGNPIMDIACDNTIEAMHWGGGEDVSGAAETPRILLLPGSRRRAYDDLQLLLQAVERLHGMLESRTAGGASYLMVVAPTLDVDKLLEACKKTPSAEADEWTSLTADSPETSSAGVGVRKGGCEIRFFFGPLPAVAERAHLLIGLGGTANQVCAGMGVPVVSIEEKGKFVQKKLLGESEVLVPPDPESLAEAAMRILSDDDLRLRMSAEGRARLGGPGALDRVVEYAADRMGWDLRVRLYDTLVAAWKGCADRDSTPRRQAGK